jgi:hypothetical protein
MKDIQMIEIFDQARLNKSKRAFTTRRVPMQDMRALETGPVTPVAGDLVLARVEQVGRLQRLELTTGRKAAIFPGDEVVVAYGNRYAPDAYEAEVPDDLSDCDLAAGGGIASLVINSNAVWEAKGSPTRLRPIGLITDSEGRAINLKRYALPVRPLLNREVPVIAVCGATMNSGKTTTVAGMVRGLTQKGMKVGAAKITGTGSGNDYWKFVDSGAAHTLDFTDAGMATTYLADVDHVVRGAEAVVAELILRGCNAIVLEIADGVHQRETHALLSHPRMQALADRWVYAADSAASAAVGHQVMSACGLSVTAISGLLTASPLAMREAAGLVRARFCALPELTEGTAPLAWMESVSRMSAYA